MIVLLAVLAMVHTDSYQQENQTGSEKIQILSSYRNPLGDIYKLHCNIYVNVHNQF